MKHSKKPQKTKKTLDFKNEQQEEQFNGEFMAKEEENTEQIQQNEVRECFLLFKIAFL